MKYLQKFFSTEISSGVILIISAFIAMLLANMECTRDIYLSFLETSIHLNIGILEIKRTVLVWINDALMAIFFLLIGLEVKREFINHSLVTLQRAMFPIITAIGGMIIPSLIYLAFNFQNPTIRNGWGIPVATDIAFALSILDLLGKRIPIMLKIFLMTLSIIDDLGAVVVIAIFYTYKFLLLPLCIVILAITILLIFNFYNVRLISMYILAGTLLWIALMKSGIHPTLSGVITGLLIPIKEKYGKSPAKILENVLQPWVIFFILPLFAFANAGIPLQKISFSEMIYTTLPISIIVSLFIGKPLGISLFCWLGLKLKLFILPNGIKYSQIMAVGVLCGVGFTMSIFTSILAFNEIAPELIILSKLGILISSFLSAFVGYIVLRIRLPEK